MTPEEIHNMEQKLLIEREAMISYTFHKINVADWHAVADGAMDLREIEAKLMLLQASKSTKS